jgi:hypothetical protein
MRILNEFAIGTYTGTTAAVSVTLGFKPVCVIVFNETDGDKMWLHIQGQAAGSAYTIDTEVALEVTNSVTLSTTGFTAGTDMSESAKVFRYIAF